VDRESIQLVSSRYGANLSDGRLFLREDSTFVAEKLPGFLVGGRGVSAGSQVLDAAGEWALTADQGHPIVQLRLLESGTDRVVGIAYLDVGRGPLGTYYLFGNLEPDGGQEVVYRR
jgi:hypothetical protein